ncbi:MAG: hypothetical protein ACXVEF_36190 [Polyangiales bacterium]
MRHAILVLPIFAFIACSSGGAGTPTVDKPGGFGSGGGDIPALGPGVGSLGGDQTGGPTDSGTTDHDTAVNHDTGTVQADTGGTITGDDAICAAKCPMDPDTSASVITSCKTSMTGAKCAAEYRAFWTCRAESRVCTADGLTDSAATSTACMSQQTTLSTCLGG